MERPRLSQEVAALIQDGDEDEDIGAADSDGNPLVGGSEGSDDEVEKHLSHFGRDGSPPDKGLFENSERREAKDAGKNDLIEKKNDGSPLESKKHEY